MISEILFDPADDASEYLVIRNVGDREVALYHDIRPDTTWRIKGGIKYLFPESSRIASGQSAYIVEADPETFCSRKGLAEDAVIFCPYDGN